MLFLLPRDMAKIGYLYLHHGEWAGRQLLPPGWADVLSHTIVSTHASYDPSLSYSNFFWILPERHVYMANGKDGQNIAVFPDLDIVVVTTARKYVSLRNLADSVSSAVKSGSALPPNPNAAETACQCDQRCRSRKADGHWPDTGYGHCLSSGKHLQIS